MKLEVGMYVRTDNGIIGKIYEKIGDMFTYKDNNRDYITYDLLHSEITKASYNVIDILEIGDYVNGVEIIKIYEKGDSFEGNRNYIFKEKTIEVANDNYETIPAEALFINKEIETIVTHEQMEQMAYKVEE